MPGGGEAAGVGRGGGGGGMGDCDISCLITGTTAAPHSAMECIAMSGPYLAMNSGFPPRMISVPLPAMLVAMVTALLRPL